MAVDRILRIWIRRGVVLAVALLILLGVFAGSYAVVNDCALVRVKIINAQTSDFVNATLGVRDRILWSGVVAGHDIVDVGLPVALSDGLTLKGSISGQNHEIKASTYAIWAVSAVYVYVVNNDKISVWTWRPRHSQTALDGVFPRWRDYTDMAQKVLPCVDYEIWGYLKRIFG